MNSHYAELFGRVDSIFSPWDTPGTPGASVAIIKDGEVIYKKGYGFANLEYDIPIVPETVFHVASVSKQFTAACVALLALEGKVDLDADIRTYLPEIRDLGHTVTVRHMVHHTSGVRDQWELFRLSGWRMDDVITHDHVMAMMRRQRQLNFAPGDRYLYSNMGYSLLAEIVARLSGQSFPDFARTRIFEPLGMSNTHVHLDHEFLVKGRSYSYSPRRGGGFKHSVLSYANMGATSLFTTSEDLARWLLNFESLRVGNPEWLSLMQKTFILNDGTDSAYAFGLRVDTHRGLRHIGHSGSDAGYRTFCCRFPSERFGVVVLTNLSTMVPSELAMKVAEVFLGDKMLPEPSGPQAEEICGEPAIDTFAGRYAVNQIGLVKISASGGDLCLEVPGQDAETLERLSDYKFYWPRLKSAATFSEDSQGISGFSLAAGGITYTGRRLTESAPLPEELAPYMGTYYSAELDTRYRLSLIHGRLVITHQRMPEQEMLYVEPFLFSTAQRGEEIRFTREHGKITGFSISGGRVKNLRFDAVKPE